jgi:predicted P-loop ATPase
MRDGKAAAEKIQGCWINEIGEMTGMRKAEIDAVKGFVSRRDDIYRAAYGRNTESRPRQCIIVGSTNDESGFLRDITGNRRFWPVKVTGQSERKPWDLTDNEVSQIWAEALLAYRSGEGVLLSPEAEAEALAAQTEAMEADDRQGIVEAYLERLLPENWGEMDQDQKLYYLDSEETGIRQRQTVSNIEIWVEALHNQAKAMEPKDARAITAMMVRIPGWEKTGELLYVNGYGRQRVYRRRNNGTNGTNFLEDF